MDLESYVRTLGGGNVILAKINRIQKLAKDWCPEEITDYFLSEYKLADGKRKLESFLLFSQNYVLESKDILLEKMYVFSSSISL